MIYQHSLIGERGFYTEPRVLLALNGAVGERLRYHGRVVFVLIVGYILHEPAKGLAIKGLP